MQWLFLNARGKHSESSSVLSKLIVSGDESGDASKLLAPSADPKGLPLRAALLRKATMLLRLRRNASAGDAAATTASLLPFCRVQLPLLEVFESIKEL